MTKNIQSLVERNHYNSIWYKYFILSNIFLLGTDRKDNKIGRRK